MKKAGYAPVELLNYIESINLKWKFIDEKQGKILALTKSELIALSEKTQTLNILITK